MNQDALLKITKDYGSPVYVYDAHKMEAQYNRLSAAFDKVKKLKLNFFSGIAKVCDAFRMNFKDDLDEPNYYTDLNMLRYRVTQFSIGILEITLVGGWIVHGIATAYFYVNRDAP